MGDISFYLGPDACAKHVFACGGEDVERGGVWDDEAIVSVSARQYEAIGSVIVVNKYS